MLRMFGLCIFARKYVLWNRIGKDFNLNFEIFILFSRICYYYKYFYIVFKSIKDSIRLGLWQFNHSDRFYFNMHFYVWTIFRCNRLWSLVWYKILIKKFPVVLKTWYTSDFIGRRYAILVSASLTFIANLSLYWVNDVWAYTFIRLLCGAFAHGGVISAYVFVMEFVGPKARSWIACQFGLKFLL